MRTIIDLNDAPHEMLASVFSVFIIQECHPPPFRPDTADIAAKIKIYTELVVLQARLEEANRDDSPEWRRLQLQHSIYFLKNRIKMNPAVRIEDFGDV